MQIKNVEAFHDRIDIHSFPKTVPFNPATRSAVSQPPEGIERQREKQRLEYEKRRITPTSRRDVTDQIEPNLNSLCKSCWNNGVMFRREQDGKRYCCLFLDGCQYRHMCPYLLEDMVYVYSYGCDMKRYRCGLES